MLPIITIARQYGSGGHEVGERLSKLTTKIQDMDYCVMYW